MCTSVRSEEVLKAPRHQPLLNLFEVCEPWTAARIWCQSRSPAGWDHRHKPAADITLCQHRGEGGREAEQTSWQSPASTDTSAAFRVRGNKLQQLPWMLLRVCEVFPVLIFCSERNVSTWSPVSLSGSHNCMNSSHWLDQSIRPETIS